MESRYYTIGMAGHIDHGKTTLTKALTNIDTDRLKEEKERNISIELGYAPLQTKDGTHVSIVDVPGHERFIRQMIAGVAGIDLVVLVIAADEGVMPQTKEHLEILEFLGVKRCIVAVTKIDRVDEELLELVGMDISEALVETLFKDAPMVYVDSVTSVGVEQLKEKIFTELKSVEFRDRHGAFRLPIDQVFTVQGQGTVVRGTIYEGVVTTGSQLIVLPSGQKVKARNIQVHHNNVKEASAGQRTAINLGGINHSELKRGDVLVATDHFLVSDTIDVLVRFVRDLQAAIKQRSPVKLHVGTSEVTGKIIFFDRNVIQEATDEILCQIRLDNSIVVRRGDRFILRRPTPAETIGGGWIIDPNSKKYPFGQQTISMLEKKKKGTPEDLIKHALENFKTLDIKQLIQETSLDQVEVEGILTSRVEDETIVILPNKRYTLSSLLIKVEEQLVENLKEYHDANPMRLGRDKAELVQILTNEFPKELIDFHLNMMLDKNMIKKEGQFISLTVFRSHLPDNWKKRMKQVIRNIENDQLAVGKWEEYVKDKPFSKADADELKNYLIQTGQAYRLTDDFLIHKRSLDKAIEQLKSNTETTFTLKDAKEVLGISRKYLIPILELLDQLHLTRRKESERKWV
ncbi:selenocysteine-specific translation elongation factor [Virgibacillus ndiopensis]|uniref:selenocysteine-specific translation elongation factor n=1 Tax=Virgibacillus ndiopensis TaxID=2004408 RepID=UPI000C0856D1|nr:selenocysteine-specific translation elongation factor [Virgibacillus ndiopensis]